MKLVAAPLLIRIGRQTHHRELSQIPLLIVDRLRAPLSIHYRVSKCPTVRRANLATVVEFLIGIVVTLRTRIERALSRTKLRALMLRMAINTTDSRRFVWLDHRRLKHLGRMTRSTPLLHLATQ